MDAAAVHVECVLIADGAGALRYRFVRGPLGGGERPDDAALRLSAAAAHAVCHSTSWRYESGAVVLTYAVVPDPHPAEPGTALTAPAVVCSGDPLRPAPEHLHAHHVAAHAVRHLAYLADTDPAIAAVTGADACWAAIRRTGAGIPADVHDEVHRKAATQPTNGTVVATYATKVPFV